MIPVAVASGFMYVRFYVFLNPKNMTFYVFELWHVFSNSGRRICNPKKSAPPPEIQAPT